MNDVTGKSNKLKNFFELYCRDINLWKPYRDELDRMKAIVKHRKLGTLSGAKHFVKMK
jgi:hypothetical protein